MKEEFERSPAEAKHTQNKTKKTGRQQAHRVAKQSRTTPLPAEQSDQLKAGSVKASTSTPNEVFEKGPPHDQWRAEREKATEQPECSIG